MARDDEFVYVTIEGHEVSKDDPAVQTRYTRAEFKALDKAAVFDGAKARIVRDQQITDGVPVDAKSAARSEGVGAAASTRDGSEADTLVDAKSARPAAAITHYEAADEAAHARASVGHAAKR